MQSTYTAFRITDYDQSKEFYVGKLGFTIDWEHQFQPDFPIFAQITKDNLSLYLTQHKGDCKRGGLAYFYVADVNTWFEQCQKHGIVPEHPPKNQPWGVRDMVLTDPDSNRLCISQRLASPP